MYMYSGYVVPLSVFLSLPHIAVTDDLPIWGKLSCVLLRKHMQCTNLIVMVYMEANNSFQHYMISVC